jgi:CRP/FNR family transcriptional regulator, anaerobic regulatory protein
MRAVYAIRPVRFAIFGEAGSLLQLFPVEIDDIAAHFFVIIERPPGDRVILGTMPSNPPKETTAYAIWPVYLLTRTIATAACSIQIDTPPQGSPPLPNNLTEASLTRPEIKALLQRGKAELLAAMSPMPQLLQRGDILVQMEEPHEYLYAIESGWLSRSRTLADGRRQIIVLFLPSEICGIKTIFMTRQPDAVEALTPASTRRIHYKEACDLAARDFAVAMHLAWQLAQDERHLHNWNVRLGRANGEERLAVFLLELRNRLTALGVTSAATRYGLPLTQQQIADHIGLTTVHVGRLLRRFRELGMVDIRSNEVVFLDNVRLLEEIARPMQDLVGE